MTGRRATRVTAAQTIGVTLGFSAALLGAATAAVPTPVQTVQQVLTVTENGRTTEQLRGAATVTPGAVLQGTHHLTLPAWRAGTPAPNPRYTVAIPEQGRYLAGSAQADRTGVTVTFALTREGPFSGRPTRTVTVTENGQSVTRTVPADPGEYRFVRFTFGELQGDVTVRVRYRVQ